MEAPRLDRIKVWTAHRVKFWALVVDGETEVGAFLDELAREHPGAMLDWAKQLDQIGQRDYWIGEQWFKQMKGYPSQWEVRRGHHRLMGFRVGDDVILCLHRIKRSDRADPRDLVRIERLAKEWRNQHGQGMDRE